MTQLAIVNPIFQPAMRIISNITNAFPASVTTTFAHNYLTGTIVRLDIPLGYGMQQANTQFGPIVVTSPTTFNIAIDTTFYDPFTTPTQYPLTSQYPQCNAFAENNDILTAAVHNALPYQAS